MNTRRLRWLRRSILLLTLIQGASVAQAYYDPSIQRWIKRDPIGEIAGLNLNLFTGNSPANEVDRDGRFWGYIFAGVAARCALPYVFAAHWQWDDSQANMKHCWVSCMIARDCGLGVSAIAGVIKEIRDLGLGGDWLDSFGDLKADLDGHECAGFETVLGGICIGNITRWFRKSCEECCRSKGY